MRRILTGLIAGTVAVAATISPVQASSENGLSSLGSSGGYLSPELSSGLSSDSEVPGEEPTTSSSGDDLTIAIAVLSTGGIIAGG